MVKLAKKKHGKSFVPGKMPVYRTVIYSSIINKIVSFPLGGSLCTCYLLPFIWANWSVVGLGKG